MRKINGNDIFENNIYNWSSWSADVLQSVGEVQEVFNRLDLTGKKITRLRSLGGNCVFPFSYAYDEENKYFEEFPARLYYCRMEIVLPFIISFADGDRLEIDFEFTSSLRMSKNSFPVDIRATGTGPADFEASHLFAGCLGETLLRLETEATDTPRDIGDAYGELEEGRDDYIEAIYLVLSSGQKLRFSTNYDYGIVALLDENGEPVKLSFDEFKQSFLKYFG